MRYPARRTRRFALAALLGGIVASSAYAFTASNTVPGSNAGFGQQGISGYSASNISYALDASNPQNIDSVTFTITPSTTTTVKVQLVTGGSWYACTNTAGTVTCPTTLPQATAATADQLTVVAAQ